METHSASDKTNTSFQPLSEPRLAHEPNLCLYDDNDWRSLGRTKEGEDEGRRKQRRKMKMRRKT